MFNRIKLKNILSFGPDGHDLFFANGHRLGHAELSVNGENLPVVQNRVRIVLSKRYADTQEKTNYCK